MTAISQPTSKPTKLILDASIDRRRKGRSDIDVMVEIMIVVTKLGRAGDRFGASLCVHCTNVPSISGHRPNLTYPGRATTKLTRTLAKVRKSSYDSTGIAESFRGSCQVC